MSHDKSPLHDKETNKHSLQQYNISKQKNKQHQRNDTTYNEDSSQADSLNYSSSDSDITRLRPTITIQTSTDIDSGKAMIRKTRMADYMNTTRQSKDRGKYHQIKLTPMQTTNLPIGDDINEQTNIKTILFHNINGIKEEENWFQILMSMNELKADIFGFAEINQTMNHGIKQKWEGVTRKFFTYSRMIHSESDIPTENYKPGGTMTTVTGKWQAQISDKGSDDSGLGRWSFVKISSNKQSLVIVTAYRPCVSQGPTTAWMQQWTLLQESGRTKPDPIKTFYEDIEKFLLHWKQQHYEIILMMDANETIGDKPGGLAPILGKVGLVDIIHNHHQIDDSTNTYARGSKRIDYILGTRKVLRHCEKSGMLPFGVGYQSDHRALFIKVDLSSILQTLVQQID
jgi:exonuclease III